MEKSNETAKYESAASAAEGKNAGKGGEGDEGGQENEGAANEGERKRWLTKSVDWCGFWP